MNTKTIGIILVALGLAMTAYTGFNFVTKKKVVDIGSLEIKKDENHFVQWSPVVGILLLAGGLVMVFSKRTA
jgi:hypothetical protein